MVLSNAAARVGSPIPHYDAMKPAPRGVTTLIHDEARSGTAIRIAPVVCETERGLVTGRVLSLLLVTHRAGGYEMLPQGEYRVAAPADTPHEATLRLLARYHREPERVTHLVSASSIILGYHKHKVPVQRHGHSSIGKEYDKLLIFVKVCVNEQFIARDSEIEESLWVRSLDAAKRRMNAMRSAEKYFAEIDAIKAATGWI